MVVRRCKDAYLGLLRAVMTIPNLFTARFIHRITKTRSHAQVEEMGGGVLADEMGMGKSLSTLALIVQTLEAGRLWAEKKRGEEHTSAKVRRHSPATLIIVPSALLINNWLNEINIHAGDALKTIKYHGQGRVKDATDLEDCDIVITTYNTLAAEAAGKRSLLHKINWYRVVLDEGKQYLAYFTTMLDPQLTCVFSS